MNQPISTPSDADLSAIQPVVLVGGKSTRFGRDKLLEPWGEDRRPLVERPIRTLCAVFGARVWVVGACAPGVVALSQGVIPDSHPGVGPIGGIISALAFWNGPVFVLAGDMPACGPATIRGVLREYCARPNALAVWAFDGSPHPCVGCYRPGALANLRSCLDRGERSLKTAIPRESLALARCDPEELVNINEPSDAHDSVGNSTVESRGDGGLAVNRYGHTSAL